MNNKNKNIKNEKGAITLFVLLTCLFFAFLLVGAYIKTMNRLHVQEQEVQQIHDNYLRNVEMADEIYKKTAIIKVNLVRAEHSTGALVNNVEIMGTGRVSRNTSKIIAYAFAKEDVKEENLTFITITATDVAQQKTVVTENGIFYFYVKDDKGDIYRSNKLEISDISDISDINSSAQ